MALPPALTKLMGTRVLVLGGSAGIGFSVAEAAMQHGAQVIISSSNEGKLVDAVDRLRLAYENQARGPAHFLLANGGNHPDKTVRGMACDLADPATIEANVQYLLVFAAEFGPIDHIVFTSGNVLPRCTTVASVQAAMMIRSTAPVILAKYLPRYTTMTPSGSLTLTSAANAIRPARGWSAHASVSASVEGLARGLAADLAPLRVNCVSPGIVRTETLLGVENSVRIIEMYKKESKTGTVGRPEDTAEAYLYCMRDKYVTGSVIATNGGLLL